MRNFRGPIQRYPGMPQDSSDEEEEDDDVFYVQPVYLPDDFSEDSDELMDDDDRVHFNLVFNGQGELLDSDGPHPEEADDSSGNSEEDQFVFDDEGSEGDNDTVSLSPHNEEGSHCEGTTDEECNVEESVVTFEVSEAVYLNEGGDGAPEVKTASLPNAERHERNVDSAVPDIVSEDARMIYKEVNGGSGEENFDQNISIIEIVENVAENESVSNIEIWRNGSPSHAQGESPVGTTVEAAPEDDPNSDDSFEKVPSIIRESARSAQHSEAEEIDEEEQFCNPMTSYDDEHNEDILRGDRIGSTTYSERHVLKLLMHWMKKLQEFGSSRSDQNCSTEVTQDGSLDSETEESMSLLWDMSAEMDVMHFLMSHNVLALIRDNLDSPQCPTRLKEIALGILANLLSCPSILEDFPEKDEHLHLVERIVVDGVASTEVPLLTQVFAVLRRVVCYIRNAKPLDRWMALFLHQDFITTANFLLASSTNVILLGDVIVTFFTLMEVLSLPHESEELTNEERIKSESSLSDSFKPFCNSDFVPSLCEGLNELLKETRTSDPNNSTFPRQRPTDSAQQARSASGTGTRPDFNDDIVIPLGHVQTAVLNGIASLSYLQKFETGKDVLKRYSTQIQQVLVGLFGKFELYTELVNDPEVLDYYAITIDLLSMVHTQSDQVDRSALVIPASTTISLIDKEKKRKNETHVVTVGKEDGSVEIELQSSQVSPFSLVFYNYLIAMEEKFGKDAVQASMFSSGKQKYKEFYKVIHSVTDKVHERKPIGEL